MKRPSFQFYPADWRNNANLRRCSWAARGAWIEIMGLMHDSDEYGVLHWTMKEIAQAIGCPISLIKELADKGVIKGSDKDPVEQFIYTPRSGRKNGSPVVLVEHQCGALWYSSRMVKDEYIRSVRGGESRFDPSPNSAPKPPFGAAPNTTPEPVKSDGSTSSSTSSSSFTELNNVNNRLPTRIGSLAKKLKGLGIEAPPHLPAWSDVLNQFSDDQIIAAAESIHDKKRGANVHLHYLVKVLNAPPLPPSKPTPKTENFESRDYGTGGKI